MTTSQISQLNIEQIQTRINVLDDKLDNKINVLDDKLDNKIGALALQLAQINGVMVSRNEVYAEDAKRVSMERFEGETNGMRERITRLESGPQKMLGWIALLVSGSVGCLSVFFAGVAILVTILLAVIPALR